MQKVLKAKKWEAKFYTNLSVLFLLLLLTTLLESKDTFEEKRKAALYDFNEKLFGQALDSFNALLKDTNHQIDHEIKNDIKLKIAICHFELEQYYKATKVLDEFLTHSKKALAFQEDNVLPDTVSWQDLVNSFSYPSNEKTRNLATLFSSEFPKQNISPKEIVAFLNAIITNDNNCKLLIKEYLGYKNYSNTLIHQIPSNETELDRQFLARYLLEALYPLNSYRLNTNEPNDEKTKKDHNYYEALFWRSRIDLNIGYYGFAKDGFEEVLSSLNFDKINRNIESRFYQAKAKFFLRLYRTTLKELETLNTLYGTNPYYQSDFLDSAYHYMGRSLFELSLFDKAILKFRTITAGYDNREPRNSMIRSTYYWLGESHYCKGELDDAIKSTSVILQYGNFREKEDAHYSLGWSYFEKNDLASRSKAKSHFEALLRDYPNSAHSLKSKLKLAEIEIEEGNAIVAEKIIESLQQNEIHKTFFERNINILKQTEFLIGLLYMKKNDYKTALDHFLKAEDTSDQKLKQKIYYHAGVCYSNLKNIKEAKSYLTIASDTPADEAIKVLAQSSLADVYYQNRNSYSDLELSISAYTDLISVYTNHPLNLEWRTKLATALRAKNDDDGAIRILNKVLDENMDEWQKAQMDIGDILMESSPPRYAEAVDHYQKIIPSLKNKEFQELANLKYGISLSKTNKNTDAIQVFQNLIKTAKNEDIIIDAYRYSAQSFSKENDLTYAVKHYEDLISKYPNQRDVTDVRNEAIKIYQQLKDSANAIKHLTEIFNAESNHDKKAEALYQLAGHDIQLQQNNNIETAKEKLLRIINDFKSTKIAPKACFDLAQLYESKEMNKEAISFYQKAIDEFTNDEITAKSHFQIGQYYYQNKKYELASQHYEKMKPADLNDDDPSKEEKTLSMQVNKADSYYMLEKYSIAKDEYMALIRKDTHNVFYRVRYARSCLKSKTRIGDAINVIEKIDANQQTQETEELLEELKTARKNTSQIE